MLKKLIFTGLMLASPVIVQAADLTIINNTNRDSTSIINNGACSTILGSTGITRAHSTNVVSGTKVMLACIANRSNCKADVYMTDNCTGPKVATVLFDVRTGIKSSTLFDNSYKLEGSGFAISLSGGPA